MSLQLRVSLLAFLLLAAKGNGLPSTGLPKEQDGLELASARRWLEQWSTAAKRGSMRSSSYKDNDKNGSIDNGSVQGQIDLSSSQSPCFSRNEEEVQHCFRLNKELRLEREALAEEADWLAKRKEAAEAQKVELAEKLYALNKENGRLAEGWDDSATQLEQAESAAHSCRENLRLSMEDAAKSKALQSDLLDLNHKYQMLGKAKEQGNADLLRLVGKLNVVESELSSCQKERRGMEESQHSCRVQVEEGEAGRVQLTRRVEAAEREAERLGKEAQGWKREKEVLGHKLQDAQNTAEQVAHDKDRLEKKLGDALIQGRGGPGGGEGKTSSARRWGGGASLVSSSHEELTQRVRMLLEDKEEAEGHLRSLRARVTAAEREVHIGREATAVCQREAEAALREAQQQKSKAEGMEGRNKRREEGLGACEESRRDMMEQLRAESRGRKEAEAERDAGIKRLQVLEGRVTELLDAMLVMEKKQAQLQGDETHNSHQQSNGEVVKGGGGAEGRLAAELVEEVGRLRTELVEVGKARHKAEDESRVARAEGRTLQAKLDNLQRQAHDLKVELERERAAMSVMAAQKEEAILENHQRCQMDNSQGSGGPKQVQATHEEEVSDRD